MSKINRPKVYVDLEKENIILTRLEDGLEHKCIVIKFIEWNENGTFKEAHDTPAVGRSIIADPGPHGTYRWMTSVITEVISDTKLKTQNSTYELHKV